MTALADFRLGAKDAPATKAAAQDWQEPTLADFPAEAAVIGVDQSLGATGMVWLLARGGRLSVYKAVVHAGSCADDLTGWERDLQLAASLRRILRDELSGYSHTAHAWTLHNESPPVGKVRKIESTLLAATAVLIACEDAGMARRKPIFPREWKKTLINVPAASKPQVRALLMPLAQRLEVDGLDLVTNEPTRDALGVALASMIREHRADSR